MTATVARLTQVLGLPATSPARLAKSTPCGSTMHACVALGGGHLSKRGRRA
jgi:hypothetical protein